MVWPLLLVLACGGLFADEAPPPPPKPAPVPQEWLQGGTLTVPEGRFSVGTPEGQWEWVQLPPAPAKGARFYGLVNREEGAVITISVVNTSTTTASQSVAKRFLNGGANSLAQHGLVAGEPTIESTTLNGYPACSFAQVLTTAPGDTVHRHGYAVFGKKTFFLDEMVAVPKYSAAFDTVVGSFRPADRPPTVGFTMFLGYLFYLGLGWGICGTINRRRKRLVANGPLTGGIIVLVLGAPPILAAVLSHNPEEVGASIANITIPLIVAVVGYVKFKRAQRKEREEATVAAKVMAAAEATK